MKTKCLVLTLLLFVSSEALAGKDINVGQPFPSFTLRRFGQTTHASLSQFVGHPLVVDFWASWCEPCKKELPVWNGIYKKYSPRGLIILGVNVDNNEKDGSNFLKKTRVDFTLLHDDDNKLADSSNLDTMPRSFLIDKKGIVRYVHSGYNEDYDPDAFEKEIKGLIMEK